MTIQPGERAHVPIDTDLEYESLEVWPDEVRIGDILAGFVVTAVSSSEHYREPAVRISIFTDPAMLPPGVKPEEFGRLVIRTDRRAGHKVPIERPLR